MIQKDLKMGKNCETGKAMLLRQKLIFIDHKILTDTTTERKTINQI